MLILGQFYMLTMILFIWNAFKSWTGNDYKPRLWRKVAESGKGQVRKVRAKWTVRKNLSLFSSQSLYFEQIQLIPTPYTFSRTHFFWLRRLKLSSQRAPSTCQETLSYTIKQTPYEKGGSHKDTSCENSTCEMNQDAHRIHLTVLHDETVFAEESVYVPAIGESEF